MDFKGFEKNVRAIPVPSPVFNIILESITDMSELKLMLRIIWLLQAYNRKPQFITESEMISDKLISKITGESNKPKEMLKNLESYKIISTSITKNENHRIIFLNSETIKERIRNSNIISEDIHLDPWEANADIPNIYSIYEQNIGMITPHIAELIKESENLYPMKWIEDAIKQASIQNKRNWAYVSSILNRWKTEGKDNGKHSRHPRQTRYR
jgi:DnaD/phage-associated family protein|tara:strand:- start:194 stop:829 length:636 start_codon:yes stop_codon:yes gene_type:complete